MQRHVLIGRNEDEDIFFKEKQMTMNIILGKDVKKSESQLEKDDSLVLQHPTPVKVNDDDDELIICSTNKSNSNPTFLSQTVEHLFGKSKSSNEKIVIKDEKLIEGETTTDEQLIDLN